MPIYLYHCRRCDTTREYSLPNSNAKPDACSNEECGVSGRYLERQWHGQTVSESRPEGGIKSICLTDLVTGETFHNVPVKFLGTSKEPDGKKCQHYGVKIPKSNRNN